MRRRGKQIRLERDVSRRGRFDVQRPHEPKRDGNCGGDATHNGAANHSKRITLTDLVRCMGFLGPSTVTSSAPVRAAAAM